MEGNTPLSSNTNFSSQGSPYPENEDLNEDNTLSDLESYYEYEIDLLPDQLAIGKNNIVDKIVDKSGNATWYQFRIPVNEPTNEIGGISDFRSIRFIRMYLNNFTENTILRFGLLDLVRSDWRKYLLSLDEELDNNNDNTDFTTGTIGIQENEESYVSPPGVEREQFNNNNTIVRQNEQSLVLNVCDLEPEDSRGVYKNLNVDMRQFKRMRMFMHAEDGLSPGLTDGDVVGFVRIGNDLSENYYQIEIPLKKSSSATLNPQAVWPVVNEINLPISALETIKSLAILNGTLGSQEPIFYNVINDIVDTFPNMYFSLHICGGNAHRKRGLSLIHI